MKKIRYLTFFILSIFLLCNSAKDLIELEDRNFIIAIGVDKHKDGLEVTTLSGDLNYFEELNKKHVKSAIADKIQKALTKIDSQLEKKIYLGHTQIIFLDKNLAKNKSMLKDFENKISQKTKIIFVDNAKKAITKKFSPKLLDFIKNKVGEKTLTINKLYSENE